VFFYDFLNSLKGFSKLIICGGKTKLGMTDNCEAIDLDTSLTTCRDPPNFPKILYSPIGGLTPNKSPIICNGHQGDEDSTNCFSLEKNEWVFSVNMNFNRVFTGVTLMLDGKLLVAGADRPYYNTSEMLTEKGWERNVPDLPVRIYLHCLATVNSTTVIAISGVQNDHLSGKTFYFTFGNKNWIEGPELINLRGFHSCGRIRRNKESQEMSVIVAGGTDGLSYLTLVEVLDEGSKDWKTGPELPYGNCLTQMVEDPNGGVFLVGGNTLVQNWADTIWHLSHAGKQAVWTLMEQKLKVPRCWHTAFLVPDNFVDCS
jgi:hypothetical protein